MLPSWILHLLALPARFVPASLAHRALEHARLSRQEITELLRERARSSPLTSASDRCAEETPANTDLALLDTVASVVPTSPSPNVRSVARRPRAIPHLISLLPGVALALVAFAVLPGITSANGVPVPVTLSYIDLSNWGPQDASGDAELIFAEGIVRIEADGLPQLSGEVYQAWLVNSEVGDAISIGRFNADAVGGLSYEGTLPPIADYRFDLLMLTVEPEPDDAPQPSGRRSLGGYFSLVGQPIADGGAGTFQAPRELPNTGPPDFASDLIRFGALAGAMVLSLLVGLRLSRKQA